MMCGEMGVRVCVCVPANNTASALVFVEDKTVLSFLI